jgi:hypothetical protein
LRRQNASLAQSESALVEIMDTNALLYIKIIISISIYPHNTENQMTGECKLDKNNKDTKLKRHKFSPTIV